MGRKYIRKHATPHTDPNVIAEAVKRVNAGQALRTVAHEMNVSKSALHRFVQKRKESDVDPVLLAPTYKHAMIFTPNQEVELAEYLIKCSKMFYGLTTDNARVLAYELAVANKIKIPQTWIDNKKAGVVWLYGFLERNENVSLRQPEATSIARSTAFNRHNVNVFFDNLFEIFEKTKATPFTVYNLDETGLTTTHKPPKVMTQKGTKQVGQITSQERGELVTLVGIVSASGNCIPPVLIFPRKKENHTLIRDTPPGTLGLVHPSGSGWMNGDLFIKTMQHFIDHSKASADHPVVIICDNHESHVSLPALQLAKENHVEIVTLPPHTSHRTQPLDKTVFGPLKSFFNGACNAWLLEHPARPISIYEMGKLIGDAWIRAANPINIISGFKACGIWPFDRHIFSEDLFMPSDVTDRPLTLPTIDGTSCSESSPTAVSHIISATSKTGSRPTTTSIPSANQGTQERLYPDHTTKLHSSTAAPGILFHNHNAASTTERNFHSAAGNLFTDEKGSKSNMVSTPLPGPSMPASARKGKSDESEVFITSPADLRGYPKSMPREVSNRGRKRGRSMVATSTPELDRIKMAAEKKRKPSTSAVKKTLVFDDDSASDISLSEILANEHDVSDVEDDTLKLGRVEIVNVKDFVLCEYAKKTHKFYYVGQVTKCRDQDDDIEVDFYRRKGSYFIKPIVPDISSLHIDSVRALLPKPDARGTTARTRGELTFAVNFGHIDIR